MVHIRNTFIDSIGNTPLIKLKAASELTGCNIYGKAEFMNPGGSVKDSEVIDACNEFGIAMLFTGSRCFRH